MPDLIALAKERRARLTAEIAKLDEFIQMGEMLVKYSGFKANPADDKTAATNDEPDRPKPAVVRPVSQG